MISAKAFNSLAVGDRVLCNYGSEATVLQTGITDSSSLDKMVKLKCDKKKWGCPFFFRREISKKI